MISKKVKNQLDLTKKFVKQKWLGIVWNFIKHFHSDQKIIFVDAGAVLSRPISPFYLLFLRYLEKLSQNFSRGSAGVEILICFKWRSFANIFSTTNADYCRHFVNLSLKFEKNPVSRDLEYTSGRRQLPYYLISLYDVISFGTERPCPGN